MKWPYPVFQRVRMRKQSGMSLVELMVALALGMAVLVALSLVYVSSKTALRYQDNVGRLQEDGSYALEVMSRDLRMSGFAGCMGIQAITSGTPAVTTYFPANLLPSGNPGAINGPNPLASLSGATAALTMQPFAPGNFVRGFDTLPPDLFTTVPTGSNGNALFFAGASANGAPLSADMTAANDALTLASDPFGWKSSTRTFIISDCTHSDLFYGKVNSAGTSIAHDATGAGNKQDGFTGSYLYLTGSMVMPAEWSLFYIATRAGASTPSLYRVRYDGNSRLAAEEVASNVESMAVHYGEATASGSVTPDVWRTTAASVTDWSRVVAVRIGLMMVSGQDYVNPGVTLAAPTLLGSAYTVPAGASANRVRREFSTTVALRNRINP